jgi:hypothetical protein
VNNVPPSGVAINGGAVNEGSTGLVLVVGQTDPSTNDVSQGFTYGYDFNNDGDFTDPGEIASTTSSSAVVPAVYLANNPSRLVHIEIRDNDGGVTPLYTTITVNNVAPVVNAGGDATAFAGTAFNRAISFTDPGSEPSWTITVDWNGDLVADDTFPVTSHSFNINHTYGLADIGNTYTVTVWVNDGTVTSQDTFDVEVVEDTFRVTSFTTYASGFDVTFNRSPDLTDLNLYSGVPVGFDAADVTLSGDTVGNVQGSIVWTSATNTLSFIKTGGVLAADTYSVTLVSASTAFNDLFGALLDGDNDFIAGGNYTTGFVVNPSSARIVSLRDFARGPGQDVDDTPATAGSKLAVRIDAAAGVTALDFDVHFDPSLLAIAGASVASGLPMGWTVTINPISAGVLKVTASGTSPLSGSNVPVVLLDASVPTSAPYGESEVIRLVNVRVNENLIPSKADYAVHKNVYLGDADGDGLYLGFDSALISRVVVNLDSGFAAHRWTDPLIVGDATADGTLSGLDASYVAQKVISLPVPEIPDLPEDVTLTPAEAGIDPLLSIPSNIPVSRGDSLTIPVNIDIEPAANVYSATFKVQYDTAVLAFVSADNGAFWTSVDGWSLFVNDLTPGELIITMFNSAASDVGTGAIVDLDFNVLLSAAGGESPLNLTKIGPNEGNLTWTESDGSVVVQTDTTAPVISNVLFGSTSWSAAFTNYLTANSLGSSLGYAIPAGSLQTQSLPWTNLNTISLVFSEDVGISSGDLQLIGINSPTFAFSNFSYNSLTFTATWTLASFLTRDKLLVHLADDVTDLAGNALDGEWTNPPGGDAYPSGNGTSGGDFNFRVNVLPGDVNGNGTVNTADYTQVVIKVPSTTTSGPYSARADLQGNGVINPADLTAVLSRVTQQLPAGEPVVPLVAIADPLTALAEGDNDQDAIALALTVKPAAIAAPSLVLLNESIANSAEKKMARNTVFSEVGQYEADTKTAVSVALGGHDGQIEDELIDTLLRGSVKQRAKS